MVKFYAIILSILVTLAAGRVAADPLPVLILPENPDGLSLTPYLAVLQNVAPALGPAEIYTAVQQGRYLREPGESVNFGLDFSTKWLAFTLTNPDLGPRRLLVENNTTITDRIELFVRTGNEFISLGAQGDQVPISHRSIISRQPVFAIDVPPGTHDYLLRVEADNVVQIGLRLWTYEGFHQKNTWELMMIGLLLGFHIVIGLYNFFLYVSVRDRMYLWYVAYVFGNVVYQTCLTGMLQYLNYKIFGWETLDNRVMIFTVDFIILSASLFAYFLLNLNKTLPWIVLPMKLCGTISIGNILLNIFVSTGWADKICLFNATMTCGLLFAAGLFLCLRRHKTAYFYTLAWSFYLAGATGHILSLIGLLPAFELNNWIQLYGGSAEVVLLSLAVGNRISQVQTQLTEVLTEQKHVEKVVRSAQFILRREQDSQLPTDLHYTYFSKAALAIGGDWVGVMNCPGTRRLYVYLGDVMGHGLSPALLSVIAAGAMRGVIYNSRHLQEEEPERMLHIMRSFNDAVFERCHESNAFMSMVLLSLDWETGSVCYVNAGHTPVLKIQNRTVEAVIQPGSLVGMLREPDLRVKTFQLEPGQTLFLYTDGLTENSAPSHRPIRLREINRLLSEPRPLEECRIALEQMMREQWGEHPVEDDTTFFLLRWRAAA